MSERNNAATMHSASAYKYELRYDRNLEFQLHFTLLRY